MQHVFGAEFGTLRKLPASAAILGGQLRELAPNMREMGYIVEFDREGHNGTRTVRLGLPPVSGVSGVSN
jgi:hypothetical protein